MRLLLACAIVGLGVTGLRAEDKAEWKEFTCQDGGYKVLLPGKPDESKFDQDSPLGKVVVHLADVETEARTYAVSYTEFPAKVKEIPTKDLLDDARDGHVKSPDEKLISEKDAKLGKSLGREIVYSDADGKVFYRVRLFVIGQRLYQVLGYGSKAEITSKEADAFLDSFKLLEK